MSQERASTWKGGLFFGMGQHQQSKVLYPCPLQGIPWSCSGLPGEPGVFLGTDCTFVPKAGLTRCRVISPQPCECRPDCRERGRMNGSQAQLREAMPTALLRGRAASPGCFQRQLSPGQLVSLLCARLDGRDALGTLVSPAEPCGAVASLCVPCECRDSQGAPGGPWTCRLALLGDFCMGIFSPWLAALSPARCTFILESLLIQGGFGDVVVMPWGHRVLSWEPPKPPVLSTDSSSPSLWCLGCGWRGQWKGQSLFLFCLARAGADSLAGCDPGQSCYSLSGCCLQEGRICTPAEGQGAAGGGWDWRDTGVPRELGLCFPHPRCTPGLGYFGHGHGKMDPARDALWGPRGPP